MITDDAPVVFIVDIDVAVRRSVQDLLSSAALRSVAFATPQELLESKRPDRTLRVKRRRTSEVRHRRAARTADVVAQLQVPGHRATRVAHLSHPPLLKHERSFIEAVLEETKGRVSGPFGAATKLGMPASTLESKIKALNIDKRRFKPLAPAWNHEALSRGFREAS